MNQESIVLINQSIHKKSMLSPDQFIEKVKDVKAIRTRLHNSLLTFYPISLPEYDNIHKFHKLINEQNFGIFDRPVFVVEVEPELYSWFKSNDVATIKNQIISWLAALYYFIPGNRYIMDDQLCKLVHKEIIHIINRHYHNFNLSSAKNCIKKYIEVCNELYKENPPEFLASPFDYSKPEGWGINNNYSFNVTYSYFSDLDWENIIIKGSKDHLYRSESRKDMWEAWKKLYNQK